MFLSDEGLMHETLDYTMDRLLIKLNLLKYSSMCTFKLNSTCSTVPVYSFLPQ